MEGVGLWKSNHCCGTDRHIYGYDQATNNSLGYVTLYKHTELLDFWTFSIARYSRNKKIQRFGNWICFCPQVKGDDT
jgi:hypothetical protein